MAENDGDEDKGVLDWLEDMGEVGMHPPPGGPAVIDRTDCPTGSWCRHWNQHRAEVLEWWTGKYPEAYGALSEVVNEALMEKRRADVARGILHLLMNAGRISPRHYDAAMEALESPCGGLGDFEKTLYSEKN